MTSTDTLADQLARAYDGDAWHGPALRRLLDGLNEQQAHERPIRQAHSIAEIVRHLSAWMDAVARRAAGEIVESASVEDWPDPARIPWARLLQDIDQAEGRLRGAAARRNAGDSEIERQLFGILQHNAYHAGQIAVLKKAL